MAGTFAVRPRFAASLDDKVCREFGVEGGGEEVALAGSHGSAVRQSRQDVDARAHVLYDRGADEDRVKWRVSEGRNGQVGLEAVHLAAEGIPPNGNVHGLQGRHSGRVQPPGQEDHAGAGPPDRKTIGGQLPERLEQSGGPHEAHDGGALTPRNDQSIESLKIMLEAHLGGGCSHALQHLPVLAKISLQSEDADGCHAV